MELENAYLPIFIGKNNSKRNVDFIKSKQKKYVNVSTIDIDRYTNENFLDNSNIDFGRKQRVCLIKDDMKLIIK